MFWPKLFKKKRWRSYREEGVFPGKGAVSTDRSGTPLEECLLGYPGDYMARINDSQNAGPCRGITVNVLGILAVPRALFMAAAHATCPYSCSCSCLWLWSRLNGKRIILVIMHHPTTPYNTTNPSIQSAHHALNGNNLKNNSINKNK